MADPLAGEFKTINTLEKAFPLGLLSVQAADKLRK
jgi:hypothetical protein